MAQTFDIRFARSAGLAAMLEAPSNSFQWTGNGSLSIDAQGISVAVKRGLLSLLAGNRTRRIRAADLCQVFREGEALRVEFATNNTARASLRFWASDRATAAHIVRLLPTSRTVEFEESAAGGSYRVNRRIATALGLALAVIAGAIVANSLNEARQTAGPRLAAAEDVASFEPDPLPVVVIPPSTEAFAPQTADVPAARAPLTAAQPAATAPIDTAAAGGTTVAAHQTTPDVATPAAEPTGEGIPFTPEAGLTDLELRPASTGSQLSSIGPPLLAPPGPAVTDPNVTLIPRGTLSFNRALRQLAVFGSESDDLLAAYNDDLERFRSGQIGLLDFTLRLAKLEKRWLDVTYRIQEAEDFADPLLVDLRATLLACAKERRYFLTSFSKGTSTRNQQSIASALEHQALAIELNRRARRYVD